MSLALPGSDGYHPSYLCTRDPPRSRAPATPRELTRRGFLRTTLERTATGLTFPMIVPASALGRGGKVAPSNRVTIAVIGTGNQGFNDIKSFLEDERVQ